MTTLSEIVGKVQALQLKGKKYEVVGMEAVISPTEGLDVIGRIVDAYDAAKALSGETSFSEFTKVANLEPRVMVEDSLRTLNSLPKFLMGLTNIYTAYYLQAIALTATINDVSVISILDRFNPNRDASLSRLLKNVNNARKDKENLYYKLSKESYAYVLPSYKNYGTIPLKMQRSLEALPGNIASAKVTDESNGTQAAAQQATASTASTNGNTTRTTNSPKPGVQNTYMGPVTNNNTTNNVTNNNAKESKVAVSAGLKNIQEADNLAVGRLVQVKLTQNDSVYEVPVAVRVRPMFVPKLIMKELVALGDVKQSWTERWHKMRSGEISFLADWVFQSDIIDHKRKLLALDKQGLYRELINRRKNNKLAALTTGHASLGSASAFIIITAQTAREVELATGQSLNNEEFRTKVFGENSAMMILVVDTEWERVITYTRGISGSVDYSFKDFEGFGKGNGPDITEIMKAYALGNNPRF